MAVDQERSSDHQVDQAQEYRNLINCFSEVDSSVETEVTIKPKKMKKKTVKKNDKLLDVVVSRTRTSSGLYLPILRFIHSCSSGTSDLMVDVDIEAGEESAQVRFKIIHKDFHGFFSSKINGFTLK